MEKSEFKKVHWKKIKQDFISKIPKRFKLDIEGLEDESEYYHPIIILDDELIIRGQCSLGFEDVYGLSIHFKTKAKIGSYLYNAELGIDGEEQLIYILNNFEKIRESLNESLNEIIKLESLKNSLSVIQKDLIYHSISKNIDKQKLKNNIEQLYSVSDYLENKRLSE